LPIRFLFPCPLHRFAKELAMNLLIIKALDRRDRALAATRRLLREERGDAMQWVMGLAIAATIIIALLTLSKPALQWIKDMVETKSQQDPLKN
jgi:hypothetical protein